jgi:tyrosine-protein phosphatase SIW14
MNVLHLALGFVLAGCRPTICVHGVPNLAQVDENVWRSGEPAGNEGWAYLKSLGIMRVVKLDYDAEGSDEGAEDAGMQVTYLPIPPEDGRPLTTLEKPPAAAIDTAVAILASAAPTAKILVHCAYGQDRTGLVVGAYRVRHEGWTKSAAHREMIQHGFHPELVGLDAFWENDVK